MDIEGIRQKLAAFARERDWDQFHSPKNLTMGLAAEAAELLEIFQWLTEDQSREIVKDGKEMGLVREEVADVFIYLVRLADKLGIDIEEEVNRKIEINKKKYPVELSMGNARKYNRR
jgi:dCTP diphosphatase